MKSDLTPGASLVELQEAVYQRMLALRSIHRTTQQMDFIKAYEGADEKCQKKLDDLIIACDRQGVERWLREQRQNNYAEMSLRELRCVGQRIGIPRYQHLSKASLLSEIVHYEQASPTRAGIELSGSDDPEPDHDPQQPAAALLEGGAYGNPIRCRLEDGPGLDQRSDRGIDRLVQGIRS